VRFVTNKLKFQKLHFGKFSKTLAASLSLLAILMSTSPAIYAGQSSFATLDTIGDCGSGATYSALLQNVTLSGSVYIRLGNSSESTTQSSVYFQSFQDGVCHLIGTTSANYGSWTKVADYNSAENQAGAIVVSGSGLGALPYQPVASILIVPNPAACVPVVSCQVTYHGFSGVLTPQIITGATDQVAVYVAQPLNYIGFKNVNYYSDDQFLYKSSQLKPLNRNYLGGGVHHISIQVNLSDQQTLTINQTINMGSDYTGTLFIRSLIYRSHNKLLVFLIPVMVLVILLLLLWVARLIYKHHRFQVEHGLDILSKHNTNSHHEDPPIDKMIIH
jgi:hypothetical protein